MTELSFTKGSDNLYTATFTSQGNPVALQLQQTELGTIGIYANIGQMPPIPQKVIAGWEHGLDWIGNINMPSGVVITVKSVTEVTGGYEG